MRRGEILRDIGIRALVSNGARDVCVARVVSFSSITTRRGFGKAISQMFYDTFQEEVEKRVHREGVKVRVRSTLKELEQSFYGSALAYDKALSSGNDDFV